MTTSTLRLPVTAQHAKSIDGTAVFCSCCPPGRREKLGELPGTAVAWKDKRHGEVHATVLNAKDMLAHWAGTYDGSAIMAFVAGVLR